MLAHAVAASFPRRPLKLSVPAGPVLRAWVHGLLLVLLFGLFGGYFLSKLVAPALVTDWHLQGHTGPAPGVRIEDGRCQSRFGMFQVCNLSLTTPVVTKDGAAQQHSIFYIFVEWHRGPRTVTPLADPARPDLLTTDLGMERLTNRILTFAAMVALVVCAVAYGLVHPWVVGGTSRRARAMAGRQLLPVAARLRRTKDKWELTPAAGGPSSNWALPARAKPFVLDPVRGLVLAVTSPGAGLFPLDEELSWLDLTAEERARIRAAAAGGAADDRFEPAAPPVRRFGRRVEPIG